MQKIEKGFSFESSELNIDLKTYKTAINHYYNNFKDSLSLKNDIPIFLDTNVLLRYYSISFKQRKLLQDFFTTNLNRFYISGQVQKEFIKNREEVIQKYFHSALESMSKNLKTDVIDKTLKYKEEHKEILKDFGYIESEIDKQSEVFEKIAQQLQADIDELRIKNKELNFLDDFLNLITNFNQDYSLALDEEFFLQEEFKEQTKSIDKAKLKNDLISRKNYAIPGIGDIVEKTDYPYGDYFIFHEMIKCSLDKKSDILFLTYDTTKGDWMRTNKEPHSHYILRIFQICERSIFIIDAERFFKDQLKTNFESLIESNINPSIYDTDYTKDIILEYVNLEKIIRTIAEYVCIEDAEVLPINKILYQFIDRGYINEDIYHDFSSVSQVRNQLAHRSTDFLKDRYSDSFLQKTLDVLNYLNDKFSNLYKEL